MAIVKEMQISSLTFQIDVDADDKVVAIIPDGIEALLAERTDLDRKSNPLYCDDPYGRLQKAETRKSA